MITNGGWACIVSSRFRCLYISVTSNVSDGVWEHKNGAYQGFTKKYKSISSSIRNSFRISKAPAWEKQL